MYPRIIIYSFLFLLLGFSFFSCSEDETQGINLNDLQSEALAEENRFRLTAIVNIFDFKTNSTELELDGNYYIISAFSGNEALYLRFPEIAKGTYLAVDDPETYLYFVDKDGRIFSSNNENFTSDVSITVTAVDSLQSIFYADFSATLYDVNSMSPNNRENQLSISGGKINRIPF